LPVYAPPPVLIAADMFDVILFVSVLSIAFMWSYANKNDSD
jgi:hypothetical protein